eukprot:TRINITY_DN13267_c0_g1_i3.p1 TRINITY_DN13267_c0_g1~~TRINITY_DN13267_c0_g1_i3.p1  ORF type:complete len:321 (+),score=35.75 TRINITY_DN13267_c0_g1_i3:49-1011(+)
MSKHDPPTKPVAGPFEGNGVDWKTWETLANANLPKTYEPSPYQLPGRIAGIDCSRRTNFCSCPTACYFKCKIACSGVSRMQTLKISEPEQLLKKMCDVSPDPFCPDFLQGVFWQRDSSSVETLITFQEANWSSPTLASKHQVYNWSFTPMWLSYFFNAGRGTAWMRIEVSPSGKWLLLDNDQFAYLVQPGDTFKDLQGEVLDFTKPGDLMRINFNDPVDPSKGVLWQYLAQRVGYLDGTGKLNTTEAYKELLRRAQIPSQSFCGLCACCLGQEAIADLDIMQSDEQILFSPPIQQDIDEEHIALLSCCHYTCASQNSLPN